MSETPIAFKDLGKFAIVDLVVHDVNEERLETALIPDFGLYTCGDKLYCAYPTLKDIKSRNWEKPVKDRQYPGPNWTSWPAVHRRDFDDYTSGREYVNTAAKKTDIESAHESERGKGKRSKRPPARYSPAYVNSSDNDSNEESTSRIGLLYDLPKPPPTVGGQLWKHSADQSHPYSTKQPHTIGSQAFQDLSFSTSKPNIDDVPSQNLNIGEAAIPTQNLNIGEAAATSNDFRFLRCNLGDEDSQLLMGDDSSETSASETTETVDGEISNPQFGVIALCSTQSGASAVHPTQSGASAVHPTQSGMSAVYPTQSGASAVYPSQSGVSGGYPTHFGSSAAYPPAKRSSRGAVSKTQPGRRRILSPQPGGSSVNTKNSRFDTEHRDLSSKTVDGVQKRHAQPELNATMPLRKITDRTRLTQNHNLTSLESLPLPNKVDDGVLKMFFKCMEELKAIKQHLRDIDYKIEGNQLQQTEQVELNEIPLTTVDDYISFNNEVSSNARKCIALVKFVKSIGGANGRDAIKRAWSALTTIECRAYCNWLGIKKGANQKYGLKGTAIVKAVLDGIKLNALTKDMTLQEFESSTSSFFVRAPDLLKKKKERAALNGSRDSDAVKDG